MAAKIRTGFSRAALIGAMSLSSLAMIAPTVVCGNTGTFLPSGLYITPTAVPGASYLALNPGLGGKLKDVWSIVLSLVLIIAGLQGVALWGLKRKNLI